MLKGTSKAKTPIVFKSGVPASMVCVAATFTGVTYANNGGKVQLVSAGVHGLTTSPAVGASVYVSWAGGTGISGLYNVLSIDDTLKFTVDLSYVAGLGTPTVAVVGADISLATVIIPALSPNSQIIADASFTMTGSTNSKKLMVRWDNADISTIFNTTAANTHVRLATARICNRNATNAQVCEAILPGTGSATNVLIKTTDTSVPTTMTISARATVANEFIRMELYCIEVYI